MTGALFIDIEASSLNPQGYPIEIAWVSVTGITETYFIFPEPTWLDWSMDSQAVHGIQRATLMAFGLPAATVARKLVDAAENCVVYSDAPVADAKWLAKLLATARIPPIAVVNTYDSNVVVCRPLFGRMPPATGINLALSLIQQAEKEAGIAIKTRHRAKHDAWRLWYAWQRLTELVNQALDGWPK